MATKKAPTPRPASSRSAVPAKKEATRAARAARNSSPRAATSATPKKGTAAKGTAAKGTAAKGTAAKGTAAKRTAAKRTAAKRIGGGVKGKITSFNPSTGRGVIETDSATIPVDLANLVVKNKSYVRLEPGRSVKVWLDEDAAKELYAS